MSQNYLQRTVPRVALTPDFRIGGVVADALNAGGTDIGTFLLKSQRSYARDPGLTHACAALGFNDPKQVELLGIGNVIKCDLGAASPIPDEMNDVLIKAGITPPTPSSFAEGAENVDSSGCLLLDLLELLEAHPGTHCNGLIALRWLAIRCGIFRLLAEHSVYAVDIRGFIHCVMSAALANPLDVGDLLAVCKGDAHLPGISFATDHPDGALAQGFLACTGAVTELESVFSPSSSSPMLLLPPDDKRMGTYSKKLERWQFEDGFEARTYAVLYSLSPAYRFRTCTPEATSVDCKLFYDAASLLRVILYADSQPSGILGELGYNATPSDSPFGQFVRLAYALACYAVSYNDATLRFIVRAFSAVSRCQSSAEVFSQLVPMLIVSMSHKPEFAPFVAATRYGPLVPVIDERAESMLRYEGVPYKIVSIVDAPYGVTIDIRCIRTLCPVRISTPRARKFRARVPKRRVPIKSKAPSYVVTLSKNRIQFRSLET